MTGLSIENLANFAEIIGAITIVTGVIFGWAQLRHYRRQQHDAVAMELMQTFHNAEFSHAVALLLTCPDGMTGEDIRRRGKEYQGAAINVVTSFETMGLLVCRKVAPFELVLDLSGGVAVVMFRKIGPWMEELREELEQPSWAEWFEWIAMQAEKSKAKSEPAHIKFRNWKP